MPLRKAEAAWHGTFRDGEGKMELGSGAFEGAYSYRSRMEDSAPGTNPEELLGAAHAGCFSMSLARRLSAEGYSPERIHTEARVQRSNVNSRTRWRRISRTFSKHSDSNRGDCCLARRCWVPSPLLPALSWNPFRPPPLVLPC